MAWKLQLKAASDDTPLTETAIKLMAGSITDNIRFRRFIRALAPLNRKRVYEAFRPHVSFKPWPFWMMK